MTVKKRFSQSFISCVSYGSGGRCAACFRCMRQVKRCGYTRMQQPIPIEQPLSIGKQKKQRLAVFITQQCLLDWIITAIRVHSGATSQ